MKKAITLSIFLTLVSVVWAQHRSGDVFLSGSFGLTGTSVISKSGSNGDMESSSSLGASSFNITGFGGFFLSSNFALGGTIGFSRNKVSDEMDLDIPGDIGDMGNMSVDVFRITNMFLFIPTARYYYYPDRGDLAIFLDIKLGGGLGSIKEEPKEEEEADDDNGFDIDTDSSLRAREFMGGVAPGISYQLSSSAAIEVKFGFIGYQSSSTVTEMTMGGNTIRMVVTDANYGINVNPLESMSIGVSFFL